MESTKLTAAQARLSLVVLHTHVSSSRLRPQLTVMEPAAAQEPHARSDLPVLRAQHTQPAAMGHVRLISLHSNGESSLSGASTVLN